MSKGLRLLFLGSPPPGMDKDTRVMTRKNPLQSGGYHSHVEDLMMMNPTASEKVPLLQEEGKLKRGNLSEEVEEKKSKSCCKCFFWAIMKNHALFVLLGFLAGLAFNVCLIFGRISPHLLKKQMTSADNDHVLFTGLMALFAGSVSTGITINVLMKAFVQGIKNWKRLDFTQIRNGYLDESRATHLLVKEGERERERERGWSAEHQRGNLTTNHFFVIFSLFLRFEHRFARCHSQAGD